jgi:uncharacterized iron-regulated membrane protein
MVQRIRKFLFWIHLVAGVITGVVILVMSSTGAVLALKPQILAWTERQVRVVTPQDRPRLGAQALVLAAKQGRPDAAPVSLAIDRDPSAAAAVGLGRDGTVYVNPYDGTVLGAGSAGANQFFQTMTNWHRWLGVSGDNRSAARSITGASNLAFLVLGLTGLYLWWPKQLIARYLKPILWFRRTATGRARDFNWHNVTGFWCLPAIIIMTASGAVISYPWASNLVYRVTGSPVPQQGRGPGPGGPGPERGGAREGGGPSGRGRAGGPGEAGRAQGGEARGPEGARPGAGPRAGAPALPDKLDAMWARAEAQLPTWSLISLRLPERAGAPVSFSLTDGAYWNAFARSQLALDAATGEIVQWQPYQDSNLGQKARGWMRFAHTGELGGLTGQIIAGLGCLGGVLLVYTGFSLAVRRLWKWSLWARWRESPRTAGATETANSRVGRQPVAD